jgi:hypothetical protein
VARNAELLQEEDPLGERVDLRGRVEQDASTGVVDRSAFEREIGCAAGPATG